MMKREGFTLAEVLITLGIIGVVAAMTIPTLISNTNGAQFKTGFKKALSTLNQMSLMNLAIEDYDLSSLVAGTLEEQKKGSSAPQKTLAYILGNRTNAYYIENYAFPAAGIELKGYYEASDGTVTEVSATAKSDTWVVYQFQDNTAFGYPIAAAACDEKGKANCMGFIDANGGTTANPNSVQTCSTGSEGNDCVVTSNDVKDIFPVFFYGQTIEPASDAVRQVLFGK